MPEVKDIEGYADREPFTLEQLASHTSGLDREPSSVDHSVGPPSHWEEKTLEGIKTAGWAFEPGKGWLYCNIGYAILGLAVGRAARAHGKADGFIELLQQRLFDPLGMSSSGYLVPEKDSHRLAEGHIVKKDGTLSSLPKRDEAGRGYRVPNGGVYSTLEDLASYVGMLTASGPTAVLSAESLAEMAKPRAQTAGPSAGSGASSYGLGLFSRDGTDVLYHGGATPGFTCNFAYDPSGWGVVILRNYAAGAGEPARTSLGNVCIELTEALVKAAGEGRARL